MPRALARPPSRARPLPAYTLYGERRGAALSPLAWEERLHCESIAERSRLHDWEIRPHRHEALFQLLVVQSGAGQAWLEGRSLPLQGPAFVTVPALSAHGFVFAPDVQGMVFTVAEPHLAALLRPHPGLQPGLMQLQGGALPAGDTAVLPAAAALQAENLRPGPWRNAALDAALLRLAVAVARAAPAPAARTAMAAGGQRALQHVQRLRNLVETHYARQPTQAVLAAQLGITPTQLNRACQQVLGHPAQAVLHARLLLQAQRELAYTDLAMKQIAFALGFADAAYFTRFFRRLTAQTPSAWRALQRAPGGLLGPAQVLAPGTRKQGG